MEKGGPSMNQFAWTGGSAVAASNRASSSLETGHPRSRSNALKLGAHDRPAIRTSLARQPPNDGDLCDRPIVRSSVESPAGHAELAGLVWFVLDTDAEEDTDHHRQRRKPRVVVRGQPAWPARSKRK
jgi:hypothetical protein